MTSGTLLALCQAPNKQLQPTVIPHRWRAASAPLHYGLAARWTRQRAAAELRRSADFVAHNPYAPPKSLGEPGEPGPGVSPSMLRVVAGVFIAYGLYTVLVSWRYQSVLGVLGVLIGVVSALGGVGLALRRP